MRRSAADSDSRSSARRARARGCGPRTPVRRRAGRSATRRGSRRRAARDRRDLREAELGELERLVRRAGVQRPDRALAAPRPPCRRTGPRRARDGRCPAKSWLSAARSASSAAWCSRRRSRPRRSASIASRASVWRNANTSASLSTSSPRATRRRRIPMSSSSPVARDGSEEIEADPGDPEHGRGLEHPALPRGRGRRAGPAPAPQGSTAAPDRGVCPGRRRGPRRGAPRGRRGCRRYARATPRSMRNEGSRPYTAARNDPTSRRRRAGRGGGA